MTRERLRRLLPLLIFPALLIASFVALSAWPGEPAGTTTTPAPPGPEINDFSAEISIKHSRVQPDGKVLANDQPETRYRFERTKVRGLWKSVMTMLPVDAAVTPPPGVVIAERRMPFHVGRIEDDGDGRPIRMYDGNGKQLEIPSVDELRAALRQSGRPQKADTPELDAMLAQKPKPMSPGPGRSRQIENPDWVKAAMMPMNGSPQRRQALERRFGRALGKVRGLDRFVLSERGRTTEMLVDASMAVPVEMNEVVGNKLVAHHEFAYQAEASGHLLRTSARTERLDEHTGGRTITEILFSNVQVNRKGGR